MHFNTLIVSRVGLVCNQFYHVNNNFAHTEEGCITESYANCTVLVNIYLTVYIECGFSDSFF